MNGRRINVRFAGTAQRGDRTDIRCTSQQSEMVAHPEELAVRVRGGGLVAEIVHGPSYPVLVVRLPSPVVVRVIAVHYWWYGDDVHPIAPVEDSASVAAQIHRRVRAAGGRP